jgi:uncharacterized protein YjbJ (UPF0337 family)
LALLVIVELEVTRNCEFRHLLATLQNGTWLPRANLAWRNNFSKLRFSMSTRCFGALLRRSIMGEFIDKARGAANEAVGKAKVAAGKRADKPELIAKGAVQEAKGKAQQVMGAVKGKLGDKF